MTDAGLAVIAEFPHLKIFNCAGSRVTDAGLEHLHQMKQLRSLGVVGTRVTPEGIRRLQTTLPQCRNYTGYESALPSATRSKAVANPTQLPAK